MNFENFFTSIPKSCKLIETNARIASKEIAYMWKSKDTAIACINIITLIDKKVLQFTEIIIYRLTSIILAKATTMYAINVPITAPQIPMKGINNPLITIFTAAANNVVNILFTDFFSAPYIEP